MLQATKEIVAENSNAGLLRFSRQYSYAPNHEPFGEDLKQIIYKEDWRDEIIVCPARYLSKVSHSVLGTNVRIFGM